MTPTQRCSLTLSGLVLVAGLVSACGGGGAESGGGSPPPPPPPPATVTYTLQLTGMSLEDTRTNTAVDPTGLPIAGATASRN